MVHESPETQIIPGSLHIKEKTTIRTKQDTAQKGYEQRTFLFSAIIGVVSGATRQNHNWAQVNIFSGIHTIMFGPTEMEMNRSYKKKCLLLPLHN